MQHAPDPPSWPATTSSCSRGPRSRSTAPRQPALQARTRAELAIDGRGGSFGCNFNTEEAEVRVSAAAAKVAQAALCFVT
eukprot:6256664-Prymnesium_polylepis.1